ncbi:MAG: hypothetical protein GWP08_02880 [Nitrospiraceae bacterium]|nr:hypothetical protein [Nitrospiraceae bacterium]
MLSVSIQDESGTALPARVYLVNENDEAIYPAGLIRYHRYAPRESIDERHFIADGAFRCELAPGLYTLRVERGLEWTPHEESIALAAGNDEQRTVVMRRWADMNALGWYSGDTHIHRKPDQVELCLLAEDLNFGANVTHWNMRGQEQPERDTPASSMRVIDEKHAYCQATQEIERLGKGWGAVLFMGEFQPVEPPRNDFYPLDASFCEMARQAGAHIDGEKSFWRCVPVCAALGLLDSVGVVHNHFNRSRFLPLTVIPECIVPPDSRIPGFSGTVKMAPHECALYTLGLYYHLLNCGLRIGASGGSANGVMPSPIGYERTYVRLDGPYSWQAWLAGLKAGRSFATNGPILDFRVQGRQPGDSYELGGSSATVDIECVARSQGLLERVELINNGRVIATEESKSGRHQLTYKGTLELQAGWVAARCFEIPDPQLRYAATSPIYLEYDGHALVVPESAAFYRDFAQALIDQSIRENRFPDPANRAQAIETIERARDFYGSLADQAGNPGK